MKTRQELLKEASILKQKLVQVENRIALTETRRMQKLAGILKEDLAEDEDSAVGNTVTEDQREHIKKIIEAWDLANVIKGPEIFGINIKDSLPTKLTPQRMLFNQKMLDSLIKLASNFRKGRVDMETTVDLAINTITNPANYTEG